jgi:hypothetical protein
MGQTGAQNDERECSLAGHTGLEVGPAFTPFVNRLAGIVRNGSRKTRRSHEDTLTGASSAAEGARQKGNGHFWTADLRVTEGRRRSDECQSYLDAN